MKNLNSGTFVTHFCTRVVLRTSFFVIFFFQIYFRYSHRHFGTAYEMFVDAKVRDTRPL